MSHNKFQPHPSNLQTQTPSLETAKYAFFDNMLMYSWLANRQMEVTLINKSLRDWMINNGHEDLANEIGAGRGVRIKDLLSRILRESDYPDKLGKEIGEYLEKHIGDIATDVERLDSDLALRYPQTFEVSGYEENTGSYIIQKSLRIIESDAAVLAGLRVVKLGAIPMISENKRDRVDIITVCQIENQGAGWRVVGFQGQLQQAWIRVRAGIEAGTQAGTVGLMGRSMSHNIGSHALFYLEADEPDPEKRNFYRYLRERMELLAGFSTVLSLSASTVKLSAIINSFKDNQALLKRIAKSERVLNISVKIKGQDCEIALPGGVLGAQAFYTILENNIRDSAKYGRYKESEQESLTINITVREPEARRLKDEFIEIVISDDRGNFAQVASKIDEVLRSLRIVDELGRLEHGNWGIKERFIAAALLRGIRLEEISVRQSRNRDEPISLTLGSFEPHILRVTDVNGNLGWAFYLMKPQDILFITDSSTSGYSNKVTVQSMEWLRENIDLPSAIRHQFVVIRLWNQIDLEKLKGYNDKLPYRVFVCLPKGTVLQDQEHFVPIDEDSLAPEKLSPELLYSRWMDWLVQQKKLRPLAPTTIFRRFWSWLFGSEDFVLPETVFCDNDHVTILSPDDSSQEFRWKKKEKKKYHPAKPVILFDRHGTCKVPVDGEKNRAVWTEDSRALEAASVYYEPHESSDPVRQLAMAMIGAVGIEQTEKVLVETSTFGLATAEAALIKILLVDERLDAISRSLDEKDLYHAWTAGWTCSRNELFHWKGVDIKGGEYSLDIIPGQEQLLEWLEDKGYDFLVLHKGIVDKLIDPGVKLSMEDVKESTRVLLQELKKHVRQIIIHSGRMSMKDLPEGCKFMALSNVDAWLRNNYSKIQIVEDICLLRRV
jgi:hypothetical protein